MTNLSAAKLHRRASHNPESRDTSADIEDDEVSVDRNARNDSVAHPLISPIPQTLAMSSSSSFSSARLLVASLGNPAPLHTTRHSAGHIVLRSLTSFLHFSAPRRDSSYGGGAISASPSIPTYTFYQSPTYMNTSGPTLLKAWKYFTTIHRSEPMGLVLLHDELELPLGQAKIRRGNTSAKGHNGVKSVQASLQGAGLLDKLGQDFLRIGVGIGRPASRERDDVSNFVLGQMNENEKEKMTGAAEKVEQLLMKEAERIGKI